MIRLFVLTQPTNVTDRHTPHDDIARAYASHRAAISMKHVNDFNVAGIRHKVEMGRKQFSSREKITWKSVTSLLKSGSFFLHVSRVLTDLGDALMYCSYICNFGAWIKNTYPIDDCALLNTSMYTGCLSTADQEIQI